MKYPAFDKIRGLVLTIEHTNDPETALQAIRAIVEHLRALNKLALSLSQKNKAGSQSPR